MEHSLCIFLLNRLSQVLEYGRELQSLAAFCMDSNGTEQEYKRLTQLATELLRVVAVLSQLRMVSPFEIYEESFVLAFLTCKKTSVIVTTAADSISHSPLDKNVHAVNAWNFGNKDQGFLMPPIFPVVNALILNGADASQSAHHGKEEVKVSRYRYSFRI